MNTDAVSPPPSRNDPCPCGSGKRYKACHGAPSLAPTANTPASVEKLMQQALAAQLDSRLDEAVALYLAALAEQPDQADCLHMLGVIDYLRNDDAAALTASNAPMF